MIKKTLLLTLTLSTIFSASDLFAKRGGYGGYKMPTYKSYGGSTRVRGYTKKNTGTYVMPHKRTFSDSYRSNNWSTQGNVNPYTGKRGSKSY